MPMPIPKYNVAMSIPIKNIAEGIFPFMMTAKRIHKDPSIKREIATIPISPESFVNSTHNYGVSNQLIFINACY
jgi:hypothetical protein